MTLSFILLMWIGLDALAVVAWMLLVRAVRATGARTAPSYLPYLPLT